MSSDPIKILLIEDNPSEVLLIKELLLESYGYKRFKVQNFSKLRDGLKCANEQDFDVLLLDLDLPDSTGIETIKSAIKLARKIPIIVLTVTNDEEISLQSIKLGVQDYIVKENLNEIELKKAVKYAIERKLLENQLKESEKKIEYLMEIVPIGIIISNLEGKIENINSKFLEIFGFKSKDDFMRNPEDRRILVETIKKGDLSEFEVKLKRKDGSQFLGLIKSTEGSNANQLYYVSTIQDITEQKKIQEEIADMARFPNENPNPVLRVSEGFVIYINHPGSELFQVKLGNRTPIRLRGIIDKILVQEKDMQLDFKINERIYLFFFKLIKESNYINIYGMDITDFDKRKEIHDIS